MLMKVVYNGVPREFTLKEKYIGPVILKRIENNEPLVMGYKDRLDKRFALSQRGDEEIRRMLEEV